MYPEHMFYTLCYSAISRKDSVVDESDAYDEQRGMRDMTVFDTLSHTLNA